MKNVLNEKKWIANKINTLKNIKVDPNNIVLNAAAFQDKLIHEMGIKTTKRPLKLNRCQIISKQKEKKKKDEPTSLIEKVQLSKETEIDILNRQKKFLSNLTFAEKTGISKIKQFPLSLDQWHQLEKQSVQRQDFKGECPICFDKLSSRESVILSCSHVFHKICLKNFEKYSSVSKCPLCRCEKYELKNYTKDKEYYVKECVIIIQQTYRGYITRYHLYVNVYRNAMPINKHLRSLYSGWKIGELTKIMCKAIEKQNKINQNLFDEVQRENEELIRLENKNKALMLKRKKEEEERDKLENRTNWRGIIDQIEQRDNNICAICFGSYGNKSLYILDCSHCFHKNCLDSFERFDPYYIKRCPLCRKNYTKREIKKE